MPTLPTPPGDVLRFREIGDRNRTRYQGAQQTAADRREAALAALAARAELTGDNGAALPSAAANLNARAGINDMRLEGAGTAWSDWWGVMPNSQYGRATGIGAAGIAAFDAAKKKRLAGGKRTGSGSGTGAMPPEYRRPLTQAEKYLLYDDSLYQVNDQTRSTKPRGPKVVY